jgi:hypothetical protein
MSAKQQDFEGRWRGEWNWEAGETAFLEIKNGQVTARKFPLNEGSDRGKTVVSSMGKAIFQESYGQTGAPSILLDFSEAKIIAAIYLSKDKRRLIYMYSTNDDAWIEFEREKGSGN